MSNGPSECVSECANADFECVDFHSECPNFDSECAKIDSECVSECTHVDSECAYFDSEYILKDIVLWSNEKNLVLRNRFRYWRVDSGIT